MLKKRGGLFDIIYFTFGQIKGTPLCVVSEPTYGALHGLVRVPRDT